MPVVNFPSENVPAPPSPNCTFEKGFNCLSCRKPSTSCFLSSTVFPCSIIIGDIPCCTSVKAENKPAGPAPTMTGEGQVFKLFKKSI